MVSLVEVRCRVVDQAVAVAKDRVVLGATVARVEFLHVAHDLYFVVRFKQEESEELRDEVPIPQPGPEQLAGDSTAKTHVRNEVEQQKLHPSDQRGVVPSQCGRRVLREVALEDGDARIARPGIPVAEHLHRRSSVNEEGDSQISAAADREDVSADRAGNARVAELLKCPSVELAICLPVHFVDEVVDAGSAGDLVDVAPRVVGEEPIVECNG